jgi:hypothetical protein
MKWIILFTLIFSSSALAARHSDLENTNPNLAAQKFLKKTVYPTIKAYKKGGLNATQVYVRKEDGCMTHSCLKALSNSLQKAGYVLEAKKITPDYNPRTIYLLSIFWKESS